MRARALVTRGNAGFRHELSRLESRQPVRNLVLMPRSPPGMGGRSRRDAGFHDGRSRLESRPPVQNRYFKPRLTPQNLLSSVVIR